MNVVRPSWFQVYVFANTIIRVCAFPRTVSCEVVVFHPPPVAEPMPSCTCAIIEHRVSNADSHTLFPADHSKHSTPLHAIQYSLVNCMYTCRLNSRNSCVYWAQGVAKQAEYILIDCF